MRWENTTNKEVLDRAREIWEAGGGRALKMLTIPTAELFETCVACVPIRSQAAARAASRAQRLGLVHTPAISISSSADQQGDD